MLRAGLGLLAAPAGGHPAQDEHGVTLTLMQAWNSACDLAGRVFTGSAHGGDSGDGGGGMAGATMAITCQAWVASASARQGGQCAEWVCSGGTALF